MRATLIFAAAALLSGCFEFAPATITPQRSKAYFMRTGMGSELWICDASSGSPVCYEARGVR